MPPAAFCHDLQESCQKISIGYPDTYGCFYPGVDVAAAVLLPVKKLLEDTRESGYRSISFVLMKIGLFSDIQDNKSK